MIKNKFSVKIIFIVIFAIGFYLYQSKLCYSDSKNKILLIELNNDTINPITSEYISEAIDKAVNEDYRMVICKLDTPGGLLTSTRAIVKKILMSPVPFVTYIAPGGSRAGSAGVFITYASHIAAMAPSTNIGAAHPVNLGGVKDFNKEKEWESLKNILTQNSKEKGQTNPSESSEQAQPEKIVPDNNPMSTKILEDTVAFIRSLAESKKRNVDWAVKSVVESKSITNEEALKMGVIEYVANDINDLLAKINGKKIQILDKEVIIDTTNASVENFNMSSRQKFFNVLADPNIAYILMILGFYGLLFEVTHPGFGMPGILGIIFLILAFYSMQTLPTNYAGLALIILGLVFFIAEAYVPGFGIFTFAGLICLILGSMFLFKSVDPIMKVSKNVILSFSFATTLITLFLLQLSIKSLKAKVISGSHGLIGCTGEAKADFDSRGKGKIYIHGELWDAKASYPIKKEEEVSVKEVNGLKLIVEPAKKEDV